MELGAGFYHTATPPTTNTTPPSLSTMPHGDVTNEERQPVPQEGMTWECKDESAGAPTFFSLSFVFIFWPHWTGNGQPGHEQRGNEDVDNDVDNADDDKNDADNADNMDDDKDEMDNADDDVDNADNDVTMRTRTWMHLSSSPWSSLSSSPSPSALPPESPLVFWNLFYLYILYILCY
jgi:hypothetical protein